MNTDHSLTPAAHDAASALPIFTSDVELNAFKWLVVLGFPVDIAAAAVRPDTFLR